MNFHHAIPILRVANLEASLAFYTGILDFKIDWREVAFVSVSRLDCCLFLCEGAQGNPGTWVWIGVGDAAALHDDLVARGANIRQPPTNYPWALEFHVEDPDGHVLRFGSDPLEE